MENQRKIRLLLVDDEEDFLTSSARALNRRGFEVHTAQDGFAALQIMQRHKFDVVVLDMKMPGIDGVEVFDRIRQDWPSVPVIMLTGHGSIAQAFETSKKGIADYISKPCDIDTLADHIRTAIANANPADETGGGEAKIADPTATVRVLLVDDEVDFLESMQTVLQRRNMQVTIAESGEEALEILNDAIIDVAVLDVKMPGMDGLDALQIMRQRFPTVKVILLSGHPSARAAMESIERGASEYLTKPPEVDDLADTIRRVCRHPQKNVEDEERALIDEIRRRYPE